MAPFIPPRILVFPHIFGIFYSYIFAINAIITILWIFKKKWFFLIPFISILTGIGYTKSFFGFNISDEDILSKTKPLKVISFNVRLFDLYNWSQNTKTKNKIIEYLKKIDADIICFQEFYHDQNNKFETTGQLLKLPGLNYHKKAVSFVSKKKHEFGIATFSKYPIINSSSIQFKNTQNNCIWTDLLVNGDTIRVYNMHLQSNYFNTEDYKLLDKVNHEPTSIKLKEITNLYGRLSSAYIRREQQATQVNEHIAASPHPNIICADLNDIPFSYSYRKIKGKLSDTFSKKGFGFGFTFGKLFTSVRIDYIFIDKNFKPLHFEVGENGLSDHRPVIAEVEFLKSDKKDSKE